MNHETELCLGTAPRDWSSVLRRLSGTVTRTQQVIAVESLGRDTVCSTLEHCVEREVFVKGNARSALVRVSDLGSETRVISTVKSPRRLSSCTQR